MSKRNPRESTLQFQFEQSLETPEFLDDFMEVLLQNPAFLPSHYGTISRVTHNLNPEDLGDLREKWVGSAYLTRKVPRIEIICHLIYTPPKILSGIEFSFRSHDFDNSEIWGVFHGMVQAFRPYLAIGHAVFGQERWRAHAPNASSAQDEDPELELPYVHQAVLKDSIPDIYCWNAYSPEILRKFPIDVSNLPSVVATETLSNGCFMVRLAEYLTYIEKDYKDFSRRRQNAKKALGRKYFYSSDWAVDTNVG